MSSKLDSYTVRFDAQPVHITEKEKNIVQLDMFINELKYLESKQKDEEMKKINKKIRLVLHILSDITKSLKEKTP